MIDQFYTPPELARSLVGCLPTSFRPKVIADFAAGEGSLLRAGSILWPGAQALANDLSPATVRVLKAAYPGWVVANADFLHDRSVRSSSLKPWIGRVDLVLLNPPFSQRKRAPLAVEYRGQMFGVSLAMAFVVRSLAFAHRGTYVLAVLPDGCLVSKRDEQIWSRLRQDFDVEVLRDNSNSIFGGVRARTSIVRFSRIRQSARQTPSPGDRGFELDTSYEVRRGQLQMHSIRPSDARSAVPLVHTCHLINGRVVKSGAKVLAKRQVCGPAILLPRVGRVTPDKICVLDAGEKVAVSDCIISIEQLPLRELLEFRQDILGNWAILAGSYRGTGAPHITLERACSALGRIRGLGARARANNLRSLMTNLRAVSSASDHKSTLERGLTYPAKIFGEHEVLD